MDRSRNHRQPHRKEAESPAEVGVLVVCLRNQASLLDQKGLPLPYLILWAKTAPSGSQVDFRSRIGPFSRMDLRLWRCGNGDQSLREPPHVCTTLVNAARRIFPSFLLVLPLRSVRVWDVEKGFCTHSFKGHQGVVSRVLFHPDAHRLQVSTPPGQSSRGSAH